MKSSGVEYLRGATGIKGLNISDSIIIDIDEK